MASGSRVRDMFRNKVVLDAALGFGASKTLSRMQGHGWVLGQKHATLLNNLCFRREESGLSQP